MRPRHIRNQDGAALIIVLIFISIFGLIIAGLLTEAGASARYTSTVSGQEKKVYAADAGISLAIQQLQQNNQLCPGTGAEQAIEPIPINGVPTLTINGVPTQVTCEVTSGSTQGAAGYAIYTRSPGSNSLILQSGQPKKVTGPVYVTGMVNGLSSTGLIVKQGTFAQRKGNGCTAAAPPVTELKLDSGYSYSCGTFVPPDAPHVAPTRPTPLTVLHVPAISADGNCRIFYPGLYTGVNKPVLDTARTNYFASGVYYFTFTSALTMNQPVYGGEKASFEDLQYDPKPACASDAAAIAAAGLPVLGNYGISGSGVEFVFGGGASMLADNGVSGGSAEVELFARTRNGTTATIEPTIVGVPSDWTSAGWTENPHDDPATGPDEDTWVVNLANGSGPDLVIHGMIYAPKDNVRLYSTQGVDSTVLGGVVAWKAELQSSAAGTNLAVSARNGNPAPRHILIRATAPCSAFPCDPLAYGQKAVISTAVVEIASDAIPSDASAVPPVLGRPATVTVNSWRTRGVNDVL